MKGVEYAPIRCVPESISLRMRGVAYKDAGTRATIDFRVVSLNEGKRLAANFAEMG